MCHIAMELFVGGMCVVYNRTYIFVGNGMCVNSSGNICGDVFAIFPLVFYSKENAASTEYDTGSSGYFGK